MNIEREKQRRVEYLECCCCGGGTRGRQWWNRDDGYGMCRKCIEWVRSRGETEAQILDYYGVEGVHWGLSDAA